MSRLQLRRSRIALLIAPLLGSLSLCAHAIAEDISACVPHPCQTIVSEACPPIIEWCPPVNLQSTPIVDGSTPIEPPSDGTAPQEQPVAPGDTGLADSNDLPQPEAIDAATLDEAATNFDLSQGLATNFGSGGGGDLAFSDIPNMMGDYIGGARTTRFTYNLAGDANPALTSGGTVATNSKISDNNSAIPRDRLSFRYHRFDDAASVNALRPTGETVYIYDPDLNLYYIQPEVEGFEQKFDTHLFEFGIERRITDNFSVEFRLPFVSTLGSEQAFIATQFLEVFDGSNTNVPFEIDNRFFGIASPDLTLGSDDVELQDFTIINKYAFHRSRFAVASIGLGTRIPVSKDSSLFVSDGVNIDGQSIDFDDNGTPTQRPSISLFRGRSVETDYNTVSLTPFLAVASQLTNRTFMNAFCSIEAPIGHNQVRYRELYTDVYQSGDSNAFITNPNYSAFRDSNTGELYNQYLSDEQQKEIREQTLLSIDLSLGRVIFQANSGYSRLQRVALLSELHYTSTLNDADIATFRSVDPNGQPVQIYGDDFSAGSSPDAPFEVGNVANRLDILNANFGTVAQWGTNLTTSVGVGVPLRSGDDRLFDWEFQFQVNYYPRGFTGLPPMF
ncbi:hypothetical protein Q31b_48090 [Novipirellula aureliae]|uniref:Uncharacterized protein n=1 Tax=Novipirellula aureliae TaxID=2527966 RepID=A0A5C6DIJ4_9BACT|nr:hypothetical protein [Novipirellula aureliae]TWU36528.1 hypothetical protein Q31b_48090 [Novipirellula aureliae]